MSSKTLASWEKKLKKQEGGMLSNRRTYTDMTRDDYNHTFTPHIDLSNDDENLHATHHVPNNTSTNVQSPQKKLGQCD